MSSASQPTSSPPSSPSNTASDQLRRVTFEADDAVAFFQSPPYSSRLSFDGPTSPIRNPNLADNPHVTDTRGDNPGDYSLVQASSSESNDNPPAPSSVGASSTPNRNLLASSVAAPTARSTPSSRFPLPPPLSPPQTSSTSPSTSSVLRSNLKNTPPAPAPAPAAYPTMANNPKTVSIGGVKVTVEAAPQVQSAGALHKKELRKDLKGADLSSLFKSATGPFRPTVFASSGVVRNLARTTVV